MFFTKTILLTVDTKVPIPLVNILLIKRFYITTLTPHVFKHGIQRDGH